MSIFLSIPSAPSRFLSVLAATRFYSIGVRHCHLGRPVRVTRGAYLYRDGDLVGDRLFLVRYGAFKTGRNDHHGCTRITSFQLQHDILALDAIGLARHCSDAVATVDSEVITVGYQQLSELEVDIWHILSDALTRAQSWSQVRRSGASTAQRMAVFLLSCANRFAALGYSSRCFQLPMSRGDLANFLGMSKESVSRVMKDLRIAEIAQTDGRRITLLDMPRLWEVAGDGRAARDFAAGGTCIPIGLLGDIMSVVDTDRREHERRTMRTLCIERLVHVCRPPGEIDAQGRRQIEPIAIRHYTVEAGQHLYRMDQPVSYKLYAIHSGQFKIYQLSPQGQQQVACFSDAGDLLGMDAVSKTHYRCSAVALCDSVLCEFTLSHLMAPDAGQGSPIPDLARMLSKGIAREEFLTLLMGKSNAAKKLAEYVLALAKRLPLDAPLDLPMQMTREDIADHLGLAPETVSRTLCDMERKGYIRTTRHMVYVVAPIRLQAVADHA